MIIRSAQLVDIPIIRAIAHAAWPVAYHPHILAQDQLDYMLELLYSERSLQKAMNECQRFMIHEENGKPIGFAAFTAHHEGKATTRLNKLYVLPDVQGTGAGRKLLLRSILEAELAGDIRMELNVNKRNKAIRFYEHMGFAIDREEVIDIGSGYVMDDYVMSRSIP